MMDGIDEGQPTFDDDHTEDEREAQRLYLRPMNPDPVSALAKTPLVSPYRAGSDGDRAFRERHGLDEDSERTNDGTV